MKSKVLTLIFFAMLIMLIFSGCEKSPANANETVENILSESKTKTETNLFIFDENLDDYRTGGRQEQFMLPGDETVMMLAKVISEKYLDHRNCRNILPNFDDITKITDAEPFLTLAKMRTWGKSADNITDEKIRNLIKKLVEEGKNIEEIWLKSDIIETLVRLFGENAKNNENFYKFTGNLDYAQYYPDEEVYIAHGAMGGTVAIPQVISYEKYEVGYVCEAFIYDCYIVDPWQEAPVKVKSDYEKHPENYPVYKYYFYDNLILTKFEIVYDKKNDLYKQNQLDDARQLIVNQGRNIYEVFSSLCIDTGGMSEYPIPSDFDFKEENLCYSPLLKKNDLRYVQFGDYDWMQDFLQKTFSAGFIEKYFSYKVPCLYVYRENVVYGFFRTSSNPEAYTDYNYENFEYKETKGDEAIFQSPYEFDPSGKRGMRTFSLRMTGDAWKFTGYYDDWISVGENGGAIIAERGDRAPAGLMISKPDLTLEDVRNLAKKGDDLTWEDIIAFEGCDPVSSGFYEWVCDIDENFELCANANKRTEILDSKSDWFGVILRNKKSGEDINIKYFDIDAFIFDGKKINIILDSFHYYQRDEQNQLEVPDKITDINDWDKFGFGNYYSWHHEYIRAFLNKDTTVLELMANIPEGAYYSYKTLEFGAYTITKVENQNELWATGFGSYIYLNIDIISSGVEFLPAGYYSFRIAEGISSGHFNTAEDYRRPAPQTPAQTALDRWFAGCINYIIYDYGVSDSDLNEWYKYNLIEYLPVLVPGHEDGFTFEEVQEYVKKFFGIDNFIPPERMLWEGKYMMGAHGGEIWYYRFLGETVTDGITSVTIQFFADASKTIKSHTVEYKLEPLDGGYKFYGSKIIDESLYEPWHTSV